MDERTQTFACLGCGETFTRPPKRGQRPKWCAPCRRRGLRGNRCTVCGATGVRSANRTCSPRCAGVAKTTHGPAVPAKVQPPGPTRAAVESQDFEALVAIVMDRSRQSGGCWIWQGRTQKGYAVLNAGGLGTKPVHRWLAMVRWPHLGSLPVHHICGNGHCVNPDHHVPASQAENAAEMLARRWYEQRIGQLEQALQRVEPGHPALAG